LSPYGFGERWRSHPFCPSVQKEFNVETANNTVTDWGQALIVSLSGALAGLFSSLPRILGFVLILLIGWFVAGLIAGAAAALLRSVKFNELATRSGFGTFVKNAGVSTDPAGAIAGVVKWAVRLITLVVAFDALGLPAVSDVLRQLLLWLPNLVVALVVLVFAGLAAGALKGLVRGATASAGFGNPDLLGNIASVAVWGFGIVVAVNQLGVATNLVNTLFIAITVWRSVWVGAKPPPKSCTAGTSRESANCPRRKKSSSRPPWPPRSRRSRANRPCRAGRPGRTEPELREAVRSEVIFLWRSI
jgi:Conserved TM helix